MSVQMDPPHVVDTGAACASCLGLASEGLQRCAACKRAWYCNRECQAAGFKEHKRFCKVMKLYNQLSADLPENIRPKTAGEFYAQRINARRALEPIIGRPLMNREARALMCEAKCSICLKTREYLAESNQSLACCPDCHWGWVCSEHKEQYHVAEKHGSACARYKVMNDSQLKVAKLLAESGKIPSYLPSTLRTQPMRLPEKGWDEYVHNRPLVPPLDSVTLAVVSKRLSQVLTVVFAMERFYSKEELESMEQVTVHVIGASLYEVPADAVWEEMFHLLPSLKHLHVAFIGPDVRHIIQEEDDMQVFDMNLCNGCSKLGRRRQYSYGMHPYHEYLKKLRQVGAEAGGYAPPTIGVAFNSGMYEVERELWRPSLEALVEAGSPCVFTSYNEAEALEDEAAWKSAGGTVLQGPRENPYRSLEPIMEPSAIDTFYYHNYYYSLFGKPPKA